MKQNSLYQKIQDDNPRYDSRFVTKLLQNYRCWSFRHFYKVIKLIAYDLVRNSIIIFLHLRSHPAILKIPNELFYENELQVFADQIEREAFCQWEYLPKKVKD